MIPSGNNITPADSDSNKIIRYTCIFKFGIQTYCPTEEPEFTRF